MRSNNLTLFILSLRCIVAYSTLLEPSVYCLLSLLYLQTINSLNFIIIEFIKLVFLTIKCFIFFQRCRQIETLVDIFQKQLTMKNYGSMNRYKQMAFVLKNINVFAIIVIDKKFLFNQQSNKTFESLVFVQFILISITFIYYDHDFILSIKSLNIDPCICYCHFWCRLNNAHIFGNYCEHIPKGFYF